MRIALALEPPTVGVLLAPGDAFGAGYESCARLCTTAVPIDRVLRGIEHLREALHAMTRGDS